MDGRLKRVERCLLAFIRFEEALDGLWVKSTDLTYCREGPSAKEVERVRVAFEKAKEEFRKGLKE